MKEGVTEQEGGEQYTLEPGWNKYVSNILKSDFHPPQLITASWGRTSQVHLIAPDRLWPRSGEISRSHQDLEESLISVRNNILNAIVTCWPQLWNPTQQLTRRWNLLLRDAHLMRQGCVLRCRTLARLNTCAMTSYYLWRVSVGSCVSFRPKQQPIT